MTIRIDPRAGSNLLHLPLRRMGLPAKLHRLPFGDISFRGNSATGRIRIGMEYKKLSDLLACITDKRLVSHQLPGMLRLYSESYLLIEGVIRPAPDSTLEEFRPYRSKRGSTLGSFERAYAQITYPALRRYLATIRRRARVEVVFTSCFSDTLGFIAAEYGWWQKDWDKHHAHLALPDRQDAHPRDLSRMFRRPSVLRRVASCLPGVGWTRSAEIARRFRSVSAMVDAKREDWLDIPGIGAKTAEAIRLALRGEK